jgi:hypothetical protein
MMTGSSLFINLARGAKILALLLFLLPFVTVSCSTRDMAGVMGNQSSAPAEALPPGLLDNCVLIQASGLQLALGTAQASRSCLGAFADMAPNANPQAGPDKGPFGHNDFAVIGAAAAILLALLLGFLLKGAAGAIIGIVASLAAIGAVAWSVFYRVPHAVFNTPPGSGGGPRLSAEEAQRILHVDAGMGFWLMVFALLLAILFNGLSLRKGRAAPAPPETP